MGVKTQNNKDQSRAWLYNKTVSFPNNGGFNEVKDDLALHKSAVDGRKEDTTAEVILHQQRLPAIFRQSSPALLHPLHGHA